MSGGWGWELVVAVGAGDHNLKSGAVLAYIRGGRGGDGGAPKAAFHVCEGGRVRAFVGVRVDRGVAFEVEVECLAAGHGVTFCLTDTGVVGLEIVVGQVIAGGGRALEGYE